MECITISSDEDEIQVLSVKIKQPSDNKVTLKIEKVTSCKNEIISTTLNHTVVASQSINDKIVMRNVPIINLADEADEITSNIQIEQSDTANVNKNKRVENLKIREISDKLKNGHINNSSVNKHKSSVNGQHKIKKKFAISKYHKYQKEKKSLENGTEKLKQQKKVSSNVVEREIIEPLIEKLVSKCKEVEYGEQMIVVEKKIWNYFNSASKETTHCIEFKEKLEQYISQIEHLLNTSRDKFMISRIIKDCINHMKTDPYVVDGRLKQLYSVYYKLVKRIKHLEEMEVESDDDDENPYIYLDRYRRRAVEVYEKICGIEGRSSDANRPTKQAFFFVGSSAPLPVQRALERYYHKTHTFPDFYDVKKLVKKVSKEENLNLNDNEVYTIAQKVFTEFGERLIHRRKCDDYNILVDYLGEGHCEDPAELDTVLQMKLEENKRKHKKEQEVLDNFSLRQASSSNTTNSPKKEDQNKSKLKLDETNNKCITTTTTTTTNATTEITTIELTSSSSSSSNSESSPINTDIDNTEDEDSNDELTTSRNEVTNDNNMLLFDSEDENTLMNIQTKRKNIAISKNETDNPYKRFKSDKSEIKVNSVNNDNNINTTEKSS